MSVPKPKPLIPLLAAMMVGGCATPNEPLATVDYVDLERFMGDWYVIASIPTFIEKDIYNAVETYTLNEDGTIATKFVFRKGSFDGDEKDYNPKGFVTDTDSNAVWGMQFVWPIKADYRVVYLDEDYSRTIIGRNKRDFVWLMARTPTITDEQYASMEAQVAEMGYDLSALRKVPQQW